MNTHDKRKMKNEERKNPIGTRNESSLHRALKYQYAGDGGKTEVDAGSFVADGVNKKNEYIEVQTGNFAPLKKKVIEFAANAKVRIIHPIAVNKIIEVYAPQGSLLYRRKSPHKGSPWEIFDALLYAPELALLKNVTIEIALVDITEIRIKDGKGSWRRKGVSIADRRLSAWHESILLKKPKDYLRFLPFKNDEEFSSSLLAQKSGIDKWTARKVLYVLAKINVVKRIGKKRNSWIYQIMSS